MIPSPKTVIPDKEDYRNLLGRLAGKENPVEGSVSACICAAGQCLCVCGGVQTRTEIQEESGEKEE